MGPGVGLGVGLGRAGHGLGRAGIRLRRDGVVVRGRVVGRRGRPVGCGLASRGEVGRVDCVVEGRGLLVLRREKLQRLLGRRLLRNELKSLHGRLVGLVGVLHYLRWRGLQHLHLLRLHLHLLGLHRHLLKMHLHMLGLFGRLRLNQLLGLHLDHLRLELLCRLQLKLKDFGLWSMRLLLNRLRLMDLNLWILNRLKLLRRLRLHRLRSILHILCMQLHCVKLKLRRIVHILCLQLHCLNLRQCSILHILCLHLQRLVLRLRRCINRYLEILHLRRHLLHLLNWQSDMNLTNRNSRIWSSSRGGILWF